MNWDDPIVEAAATDTGMRRTNNQDSFAVVRAPSPEVWKNRGHVFMVADGMGAHAVGELASKMACDNIPHNYHKIKAGTPSEAITKAYLEVGLQIHGRASANRDFQGMGTTCSTLLALPQGVLIAHVGDSRVYRIRNGQIDQLSYDHSLVWELVRLNHLTPEQASRAVPRNVITRSLGPDPKVEVDIEGPLPIEKGDVFLLCSDGLSGPVKDPELGMFAGQFHPTDACRYLTHLANLRGGHDNITTVIVRFGPWVEPGTAASDGADGSAAEETRSKGGRGGMLGSLLGSFRRAPAPPEVEEHRYRSCQCSLQVERIEPVAELLRKVQAAAVDQAWALDWPTLTAWRKKADETKAAGDLRGWLQALGEGIALLGTAGRLHRKAHSSRTSS